MSNLSRLPNFADYRDPNAPPDQPAAPPRGTGFAWQWGLAGAVVGVLFGGLPEMLALLGPAADPFQTMGATLRQVVLWGVGTAIVGAVLGALCDEASRRGCGR